MQSCPIMQWPPENLHWLEMLELLVKHGASVHELNGGKTITALNLTNEDYEPDILIRFFNLLLGQNYIDFDVLDFQKPSALLNAIRSGQNALQAIDTLSAAGVDLKRVAPDGRSALHLAAEMSMDEAPLKHLQQKYGLEEVNRKDQWGWTPLHYAIFSASNQTRKCRKVRYLLEQGADPYIDSSVPFAVVSKFFHPTHHGGRGFTPFQWAVEFGADVFERFVDDMRATGPRLYEEQGECDDDDDNGGDQFYDAREGC